MITSTATTGLTAQERRSLRSRFEGTAAAGARVLPARRSGDGAIGRTFMAKHGGRLDANQEFLALVAANLAAGLGRAFPSAGA